MVGGERFYRRSDAEQMPREDIHFQCGLYIRILLFFYVPYAYCIIYTARTRPFGRQTVVHYCFSIGRQTAAEAVALAVL